MKNFLTLFFLLGFGACGSDTPLVVPDPKLSDIQKELFNNSCTFSSCHNDSSAQGNLKLTSGNSFSELVNVSANQSNAAALGKIRVIPGDPDNSYLIQKLEGPVSGEGDQMPRNNERLPQTIIDSIREWIANGALDN